MNITDQFTRLRTAVTAAQRNKGRASTVWRRHLAADPDAQFFLGLQSTVQAIIGLSTCVRLAVRKEHPVIEEVPTTVLGSLRYLGVPLVVQRPAK